MIISELFGMKILMKMGGKGFETLAQYLESSYTSLRPKRRDLPEGFWVAHQAFTALLPVTGHLHPSQPPRVHSTHPLTIWGLRHLARIFFTNALLSFLLFQCDHDSTYVHHSYC
jgi:hypothetical protein